MPATDTRMQIKDELANISDQELLNALSYRANIKDVYFSRDYHNLSTHIPQIKPMWTMTEIARRVSEEGVKKHPLLKDIAAEIYKLKDFMTEAKWRGNVHNWGEIRCRWNEAVLPELPSTKNIEDVKYVDNTVNFDQLKEALENTL